jgi:L-threonylcarbamoyladenylate synthase
MVTTEILSALTPDLAQQALDRAARLLQAGEVVALPTETVYGLAANALDEAAVAKIFEVKGRPSHNPIIVHVADEAMARSCVRHWPSTAHRLAAAFWPGPLTLVLHKSPKIPSMVVAGGDTVGVRWPQHPFMRELIRRCGFPLAAPSANPSNRVSPTEAGHVLASLGGRIPLVVDGGPCEVGIESTVVDLTVQPVRVLRPGMIHEESLAAVLDQTVEDWTSPKGPSGHDLRSPGLLPKHYAPNGVLHVLAWRDADDLRGQLRVLGVDPPDCHLLAHTAIPAGLALRGASMMPRQAASFARALYGELHRCDEQGARWIIVEQLPTGPQWRGISDRLHRASVA